MPKSMFYRVETEHDRFDLDACRTCLEPSASVPLFSAIDEDMGVMVEAIAGVAVQADDGLPAAVCVSCAGSLRAAYHFRLRAQLADRTLRRSRLCHDGDDSFNLSAEQTQPENQEPSTCQDVLDIKQEEATAAYQIDLEIKEEMAEESSSEIDIATSQDEIKIKQENESFTFEDDLPTMLEDKETENSKYQNDKSCKSQKPEQIVVTPKFEIFSDQKPLLIPKMRFTGAHKNVITTPMPDSGYVIEQVGPGMLKKSYKPYKCDIKVDGVLCGERLKSKYTLRRHKRQHIVAGVCDQCGRSFSSTYDLKLHQRRYLKRKRYYCDVCNQGFDVKKTLISHLQVHPDNKEIFPCKECPRTFFKKQEMVVHVREVHRSLKRRSTGVVHFDCCDDTESGNVSSANKISCTECPQQFSSKTRMLMHVKEIHKGEKGKCGVHATHCDTTSMCNGREHGHLPKRKRGERPKSVYSWEHMQDSNVKKYSNVKQYSNKNK